MLYPHIKWRSSGIVEKNALLGLVPVIPPGSSDARPTGPSHAQSSGGACFLSWLTGCFGPTPTLDISTSREEGPNNEEEGSNARASAFVGEDLDSDNLPELKGGLRNEAKDPTAYKQRFAEVFGPTAAPGEDWWCGVTSGEIKNPNELRRLYVALDELLAEKPLTTGR